MNPTPDVAALSFPALPEPAVRISVELTMVNGSILKRNPFWTQAQMLDFAHEHARAAEQRAEAAEGLLRELKTVALKRGDKYLPYQSQYLADYLKQGEQPCEPLDGHGTAAA